MPDLPGYVAVGNTIEETKGMIRKAIQFHLESLRESGEPIPEAASLGDVVEVDVSASV